MRATAVSHTFLLPDLGEGLTEAEIVRWLVAVGDHVDLDQLVMEVETAKSVVEVPSPYAGTVLELHAAEGEIVAVGKPLITIDASAGRAPNADAEVYRNEERAGSGNVLIGYGTSESTGHGRRRRPGATTPTGGAEPTDDRGTASAVSPVISPLVRRLAQDNGVDARQLTGTGPGGLVTRADVEAAIGGKAAVVEDPVSLPATTTGEHRTPLNGFRKAVSVALTRSRSEIPEATVWVDVDATALWELRAGTGSPGRPGPGLLAYLARFVIAGLREYPVLNARMDTERDEIVEFDHVNLGIAVQGDRGLVVPAVMAADRLTTNELDTEIRSLTARAREGKATAEELAAGTFTLNNYGGFRVDGSAAIINHPQVAILGFGRIIDRPWVVDGQITIRKITQMSFVFDHRVCDGATAAGFMRSVADAIENPAAAIGRL